MSQFFDRGLSFVFGGGLEADDDHSTPNLPPPRPPGTNYVSKQDRASDAAAGTSENGPRDSESASNSTATAAQQSSSGSRSVNVKDLDRDQLIQLCQKLNKKLHTQSNKVKSVLRQATDRENDLLSVNSVLSETLNVRVPYAGQNKDKTGNNNADNATKSVDIGKLRRNLKAALREREAEEQSMRTSLQAQLDQMAYDNEERRKSLENEIDELQQTVNSKDAEIENLLEQLHQQKKSREQSGSKVDQDTQTEATTETTKTDYDMKQRIETLKEENGKKEDEMQSMRAYYEEELRKTQTKSTSNNGERVKELEGQITSLEDKLKNEQEQTRSLEASLRDAQGKAKSTRNMIARKDGEIEALKKQVSELKVKAEYGSPAEQHFVKLAEEQAKRDYSIRHMEQELKRSNEKVEALRAELSATQTAKSRLETELSALKGSNNYEKVNMVYLKNVVVNYMAYADDAAEKQSLRRVIGTLLQFSHDDEEFLKKAPIPGGIVKQALEPQQQSSSE